MVQLHARVRRGKVCVANFIGALRWRLSAAKLPWYPFAPPRYSNGVDVPIRGKNQIAQPRDAALGKGIS
jgi:hypothetical protein